MITDRLDLCPFCQTKLVKRDTEFNEPILDCPNQKSHKENFIWAWYYKDSDLINAVNIRVGKYQLCWGISLTRFALIDTSKPYGERGGIFVTSEIIDFPLQEDVIKNKIKTILLFH